LSLRGLGSYFRVTLWKESAFSNEVAGGAYERLQHSGRNRRSGGSTFPVAPVINLKLSGKVPKETIYGPENPRLSLTMRKPVSRFARLTAFGTVAELLVLCAIAHAQFREVGPAPFPPAQAHRKIRMLLDQVDADNRQQTVKTIVGWLNWFRDALDDELIATWRGDKRVNLNLVIDELGDARVATEVIRSWRQPGLGPATAPILTKLMARYSESASPFFHDVLQTPDLSGPEAEAVCRILLDLPDRWRGNALQVLPHYRGAVQNLLAQDLRESDEEKVGRAQFWLRDLKWNVPGDASDDRGVRQALRIRHAEPMTSPDPPSPGPRPSRLESGDSPAPGTPLPLSPGPPPTTSSGAKSGVLECSGNPIPQNAEYVFRNVPSGTIRLDYDTKTWEARLLPGDGQTQRLILRNKSSGPQKRCVVHWSVLR
jgi:hypothetical protein